MISVLLPHIFLDKKRSCYTAIFFFFLQPEGIIRKIFRFFFVVVSLTEVVRKYVTGKPHLNTFRD